MQFTYTRQIPCAGEYDVIVCGGGPAGWVAAVAAARAGAKTALVERYGFLGGAATASLVVPVSGFYKNGERVVGGIAWEFIERLQAQGAALVELPKGHVSVDPEFYKLEAQRMVTQAGVTLFSHATLSGAIMAEKTIQAVVVETTAGSRALCGRVFIDATGEGMLCSYAGVPTFENDEPQPLSLCFTLTGVDVTTPLLRESIHHTGKNGTASVQSQLRDFLNARYAAGDGPMFGGPWLNTLLCGDLVAVNMTRSMAKFSDYRAFSLAEMRMREEMFQLVALLRSEFAEFRHCAIAASAVQAGVRDGRHLCGAHLLTGEELEQGVHFPDAIARNAHPFDMHKAGSTAQGLTYAKQAGYIPYRSLFAPGYDNFLAAGQLIAADPMAHSSIRVQATAMAIGQAAGTAAALCCQANCTVEKVDIAQLQALL